MLDRKLAPDYKLNSRFNFLTAQSKTLPNGVKLYSINTGKQKMIKLDLVFDAGYSYHNNSIIPTAVSQLIFEGTKKRSSLEIAELIEGEGGFFDASCGADHLSLTIYSLVDRLSPILDILKEVITLAIFPKHEIDNYVKIQKQKFLINSQKVSFIARNKFNDLLYNHDHPYHSSLELSDFDLIQQKDIIEFYQKHILDKSFRIYASGAIDEKNENMISEAFGDSEKKSVIDQQLNLSSRKQELKHYLKKEDALQSAIRLGGKTISKKHEDYIPFFMLNTILGGYFGSRLMSNIREDKGFTYGIGSGIVSNRHGSHFFIATEVGAQYTDSALFEIEKEIKRLRKELVSAEELQLVKNYMIGSLMRSFDGVYEAMDRFKALNELNLNYSYYESLFDSLEKTSPKMLLLLAQKYLRFDDMFQVVAGNRSNHHALPRQ